MMLEDEDLADLASASAAMLRQLAERWRARLQAGRLGGRAPSQCLELVARLDRATEVLERGADGTTPDPADGSARRTAHALTASEERYRLLVDSVLDYAIFMLDPDGRVASWNAGAERLKGYRAQEILGQHLSRFYTAEDLARGHADEELRVATRDGRFAEEGWRVRKDGSRFWASVVITAIRDPGGRLTGFAKVTRDLTERRRAEEALRLREEQLATTLHSIGDAVIATDARGRVTLMNPVAEALTGWRGADAAGRPLAEVFEIVNEETRAPAQNPVARVLREGVVVGLANHTALIARGGAERPIADSAAPIRSPRGEITGVVLVFRDQTAERDAEHERMRLAHAQEALRLRDEFLSVAAHELRTPLTALQLQLDSLAQTAHAPDDGDVATRLAPKADKAQRQAARLAALVDALLDLSRVTAGRLQLAPESLDLVALVRDAVETLRTEADRAGCALRLEATEPVHGVWDRLRLEQVVTNLLSNALKFGRGRPVVVTVTAVGGRTRLTVRDNGIGIAPEDAERIFVRFERGASASHYGGLGLGLYLSRVYVAAHGGSIRVVSTPDAGATFEVDLPLAPPETPAGAAP